MPAFVIVEIEILQFPSLERARAWHASPEHAPALALRRSCATSTMLLLEGLPVPFVPGRAPPPAEKG